MKRGSLSQPTEAVESGNNVGAKHLEAASVDSQSSAAGQSYELIKSTQVWNRNQPVGGAKRGFK